MKYLLFLLLVMVACKGKVSKTSSSSSDSILVKVSGSIRYDTATWKLENICDQWKNANLDSLYPIHQMIDSITFCHYSCPYCIVRHCRGEDTAGVTIGRAYVGTHGFGIFTGDSGSYEATLDTIKK